MEASDCPRVAEGIEINVLSDGYVIYDPKQDRVHYLNRTAVLILELCNGQIAAGELPALVQTAYELAEPPFDDVSNCLALLLREGLVS